MQEGRGHHNQRGLTLIEVCMTLAIAVVLLGTAIPSFQRQTLQRSIEGTASQLVTDLQFLRSEAVARNQPVRVSFASVAGGSCYVMHTGGAGDCTCNASGPATCVDGAQEIKTTFLPDASGARLQTNVASMVFAPLHGTVTPASTIRVVGADGRAIHNVVNIMGRVRSCSPSNAVRGYPAC